MAKEQNKYIKLDAEVSTEGHLSISKQSRRHFIRSLGLAMGGAATMMNMDSILAQTALSVSSGTGATGIIPPKVFDIHSHYTNTQDPEWVNRALKAGLNGAFFSLVPDGPAIKMGKKGPEAAREMQPGEAWSAYKSRLERLRTNTAGTAIRISTHAPAEGASQTDTITSFIHCEGAHMLEGRLERMEEIYQDGVRSLELVHYVGNDLGDHQTEAPRWGGLSDFGRKVVKEANRLGIIIDVAHATYETTRDVVELSEQPVILSHSYLIDKSQPPTEFTRLISVEHARLVSESGGIIGVWPALRSMEQYQALQRGEFNLTDVHQDILRMIEAVGVNHVGIGTDLGGGPTPFTDYAQLDLLIAGLRPGGLSDEEISKVAGGNAWRIVNQLLSKNEKSKK